MTAPLAGPSAGANERRTRAASGTKRASSQPRRRGADDAPARTLRRIDAAVDDLDAGDRALGEKASSARDVVRRPVAERHRDRAAASLAAARVGAAAASRRRVARRVRRRRVGFMR